MRYSNIYYDLSIFRFPICFNVKQVRFYLRKLTPEAMQRYSNSVIFARDCKSRDIQSRYLFLYTPTIRNVKHFNLILL